MMSQANANEQPAPAATPFILQIIGLGIVRIKVIIGLYLLSRDSLKFISFPGSLSFKSCPLQNAFPAPLNITTRALSSLVADFSASINSKLISLLNELYESGLLSVIEQIPFSIE